MMTLAKWPAAVVVALCAAAGSGVPTSPAVADAAIEVTIKNHTFIPAEVHVPAGQAIVLTIVNQDATPEEFDSSALKVEKVIPGGSTGTVRLRPLSAGSYPFVGEYHEDTAKGVVIAE